jgi:hypothetical protein
MLSGNNKEKIYTILSCIRYATPHLIFFIRYHLFFYVSHHKI